MLSLWCLFGVRLCGCSFISQELLDKTYIVVHHQIELNERINMIALFGISTSISRVIGKKFRKMSKNEKLKLN